jgi:hypothetical protein
MTTTGVRASDIKDVEDVPSHLTLPKSYFLENMDGWTPVTGDDLNAFFTHKIIAGRQIEKQYDTPLLLEMTGSRIASQSLDEARPDRGDVDIKEDKYCVYWNGNVKRCYKLLSRDLAGSKVYLITRDDGSPWMGVEIVED